MKIIIMIMIILLIFLTGCDSILFKTCFEEHAKSICDSKNLSYNDYMFEESVFGRYKGHACLEKNIGMSNYVIVNVQKYKHYADFSEEAKERCRKLN